MWAEVKQAARFAFRPWPFAAAVILTLALCAATSAAAWTVFYGVLLKPLALPEPDRLVTLGEQYPGLPLGPRGGVLSNVAYHLWTDAGSSTIGPIGLYRVTEHTIAKQRTAWRALVAEVSPNIGVVLRATPNIGRWFSAREGVEPAREVVVSHDFWREHFSSDPGAVGQAVSVDGARYVVVGVAAPDFAFPTHDVRLWVPLDLHREEGTATTPNVVVLNAVSRLRPGVTVSAAESEGTTVLRRAGRTPLGLRVAFGSAGAPAIRAFRFQEALTADVKPALVLIAGAVLAIYVIACANLASLFLARSTARRRELAIRRSIGATSAQIVRLFLREGVLLAVPGAALGLAMARSLVVLIQAIAPHDVPRLADVDSGAGALVVGLTAAIAAVGFGSVLAILSALKRNGDGSTGESGGRTLATQSPRSRRAHNTLLAAEAAGASVVLIATVLLGLSMARLLAVDPGYVPQDVLVLRVFVPGNDDADDTRRWRLTQDLLQRVRGLPGVVAAGATNMFPFDPFRVSSGFPVPGEYRVALPSNVTPRTAVARRYAVTSGYAESLRLRVLSGRFFTDQDRVADCERWVVSKEFARLYLPPDPVGRRFPWTVDDRDIDLEIIGVVDDVLKDGLDRERQPEIYDLMRNGSWGDIKLVVRTAGRPDALLGSLRSLATGLAPDAAVDVTPLDDMLANSVSGPRFLTTLVGLFAAIAIALACGGLYAVLTFNVSQRRHELAIRSALGATSRRLVWLVMHQALRATTMGVLAGLGSAAIIARLTEAHLFHTSPFEPVAFGISAGALLVVASLAAGLPALRAATVEPNVVLRSE